MEIKLNQNRLQINEWYLCALYMYCWVEKVGSCGFYCLIDENQ